MLDVEYSRTMGSSRLDDDGGEAEGHLVEHQQPGVARQRAGDCQHLLLAAGQQAGPAPERRRARGSARTRLLVGRGGAVEPEVLGHGQAEEEPPVVTARARCPSGPARSGDPGQVGARQPEPPRRRFSRPEMRARWWSCRRRWRRAARPPRRTHGQRKVADDRRAVVGDAHRVKLKVGGRRRCQAAPPAPDGAGVASVIRIPTAGKLVQHAGYSLRTLSAICKGRGKAPSDIGAAAKLPGPGCDQQTHDAIVTSIVDEPVDARPAAAFTWRSISSRFSRAERVAM